MSKLPNAPLLEVIFEIRWDLTQDDSNSFQYLHGDLYSELKADYPYREALVPAEIPIEALKGLATHRFRKKQSEYPVWQVGLGVITVNFDDYHYFWDDFMSESQKISSSFLKVFPNSDKKKFIPSLSYIDFFNVDEEKVDLLEFINANFSVNVSQKFIVTDDFPKEINISFTYQLKHGELTVLITKGIFNNTQTGITLQTKFIGNKKEYNIGNLNEWLEEAHSICSDSFKRITDGGLYESFKTNK